MKDWGPMPTNKLIDSEYHGLALKYLNEYSCKFCGEPALTKTDVESLHRHDGGYICEDCWDERLRCTESE